MGGRDYGVAVSCSLELGGLGVTGVLHVRAVGEGLDTPQTPRLRHTEAWLVSLSYHWLGNLSCWRNSMGTMNDNCYGSTYTREVGGIWPLIIFKYYNQICVWGFCIHRLSQLGIENIFKKLYCCSHAPYSYADNSCIHTEHGQTFFLSLFPKQYSVTTIYTALGVISNLEVT